MYSYKLNNSYTIYVNYEYLNECRKASRVNNSSITRTYAPKQKVVEQKRVHTLAENTTIYHQVFGYGKVSKNKEAGYISIIFGDVVKKFLYPQAFDMGFLARN